MPLNFPDVFPFPFPGRPSRPARRRPPRQPARVWWGDVAKRAGPGAVRLSYIGAAGYAAYTGLKSYIDKKEREQLLELERIIRDQDARANEIYRRTLKLKLEREKELAAARKKIDAVISSYDVPSPLQQYVWDPKRQVFTTNPAYLQKGRGAMQQQLADEQARRELRGRVLAAGGTLGDVPAQVAAAPAPAPPPQAAKESLRKRAVAIANKLLSSPLGALTAGVGVAFLGSGGKPKPDPAPEEFFEPDLTGFESEGVTFGELGGELAFEPDPETGTRGDECETIDPARTPGECRQGWFSETPERLYLKEWSRRPCQ